MKRRNSGKGKQRSDESEQRREGTSEEKSCHQGIAVQSSTCRCRGCRRGSCRSQSRDHSRRRSSRQRRCRYGCSPPHYTHARAEISIRTRATSACKLDAGTDKTRANEEGKFWQRKTEERQIRTKKRGEKRREELSSRYCCTVQYLQVP